MSGYGPNSGPHSGWTSREYHTNLEQAHQVNSTGVVFNEQKGRWEYWLVSPAGFKFLVSRLRTDAVFYDKETAYADWFEASEQTSKYILGAFQFALSASTDHLVKWLGPGLYPGHFGTPGLSFLEAA